MKVDFAKTFDKQFEKLPQKRQERARTAIALFLQDVTNKMLRNHPLKGKWLGYHSISAGGDLRLHFLSPSAATANSINNKALSNSDPYPL